MSRMKTAIALLLAAMALPTPMQNNVASKDWIQLFNGRNLDGWVPKLAGYPLGEEGWQRLNSLR